jgi:peptide deformylase
VAILPVYHYPHPSLRTQCEPVTQWDTTLTQLVNDLLDTMYAYPGCVGLSAPQVGVPLRVFVLDVGVSLQQAGLLKVFVNPVVTTSSRNKLVREGCLSFPQYLANVKRATRLTVETLDHHQTPSEFQVDMLEAVAVQHEIDHLDGVLMIDRVQSIRSDWIRRRGHPSPQE